MPHQSQTSNVEDLGLITTGSIVSLSKALLLVVLVNTQEAVSLSRYMYD